MSKNLFLFTAVLVLSLVVLCSVSLLSDAVAAKGKTTTLDTDPNLVVWYKFDETSGKIAKDSSKHKRKAALKGEFSFDEASVEGKIGRALKFDGDDLVEILKYKGVTGTHARTVSAWIKTRNNRGEIISWGKDDYGQMFIYQHIRGRIGLTPSGGYYYMNDMTNDEKWYHVAVVVLEAELPNLHDDIRLYKNGEIAEIHDIGLLDLWPVKTGKDIDVRIGRRYNGIIDDLRIYDRPLNADEIKALFKLKSNEPLPESK